MAKGYVRALKGAEPVISDHALESRDDHSGQGAQGTVQRPRRGSTPGTETAYVAMGCFWGAERKFFELDGVVSTAVGYQGGFTPNPTYQEVCSGMTGHAEAVKVVFDPTRITYAEILRCFYENHDPTQGFRQGGDVGTQYRSAIFFVDDRQGAIARQVTSAYAEQLRSSGYGAITTEIVPGGPFYMAEEYHQQYLIANPSGYCGLGGTGVSCPVGLAAT
jgi:peptide-methionine (S)-S-oxide reductase